MFGYSSDPNILYPDSGYQSDNPFGKFTPNTYQSQQNSHMHSFSDAFKRNEPLIEKQNFKNNNDVLHNNLGDKLQSEYVVDYTIDIDSLDRDVSAFQDPFKYTVTFSPMTASTKYHEEWIDASNKSLGKHTVSTVYNGSISPCILKSFRNIKYIRVDNVILPKYGAIKYDSGSSSWIMDTTKNLAEERYIVMKFKNVDSHFNMSTNEIVDSTGIKLIPDTIPDTGNFFYSVPSNANNIIKIYNTSLLGNLDKLYVEFYDGSGNQLKYNNLDTSVSVTDVRNPKNVNLQHDITLIFGVVENELTTDVKFSK